MIQQRIYGSITSTAEAIYVRELFGDGRYVWFSSTEECYLTDNDAQATATSPIVYTGDQSAVSASAVSETDGYIDYTVASSATFKYGQTIKITDNSDVEICFAKVHSVPDSTSVVLKRNTQSDRTATFSANDKLIILSDKLIPKSGLMVDTSQTPVIALKAVSGSVEVVMATSPGNVNESPFGGIGGSSSGCTTSPPIPISLTAGASISANTDAADFDCDYVDSAGLYVGCTAGTSVDVVCYATIGGTEFNVTDIFFGSGVSAKTIANGNSEYFSQTRSGEIQNWDSLRIEIQPSSTETYVFVGKLSMRY